VKYEVLEHTADLMVRAYGKTLEECFANAAYALFDRTVDLSGVSPLEGIEVRTSGDCPEGRLYSFLAEMLFIEDCENLILCDFDVRFDGNDVVCKAKGEKLDRAKHRTRSEIKAVTYHMMEIDPSVPSVTVIFDT
jgi:SHS2 domain-containing protein